MRLQIILLQGLLVSVAACAAAHEQHSVGIDDCRSMTGELQLLGREFLDLPIRIQSMGNAVTESAREDSFNSFVRRNLDGDLKQRYLKFSEVTALTDEALGSLLGPYIPADTPRLVDTKCDEGGKLARLKFEFPVIFVLTASSGHDRISALEAVYGLDESIAAEIEQRLSRAGPKNEDAVQISTLATIEIEFRANKCDWRIASLHPSYSRSLAKWL